MTEKKMVRIRFLGDNFLKGIPQDRVIRVGTEQFWNFCKFPEQEPDGSYIRPLTFFEKHKDILNDKKRFICEPIALKRPTVYPELEKKGVVEIDGVLVCPSCNFEARGGDPTGQMTLHMKKHEIPTGF